MLLNKIRPPLVSPHQVKVTAYTTSGVLYRRLRHSFFLSIVKRLYIIQCYVTDCFTSVLIQLRWFTQTITIYINKYRDVMTSFTFSWSSESPLAHL